MGLDAEAVVLVTTDARRAPPVPVPVGALAEQRRRRVWGSTAPLPGDGCVGQSGGVDGKGCLRARKCRYYYVVERVQRVTERMSCAHGSRRNNG